MLVDFKLIGRSERGCYCYKNIINVKVSYRYSTNFAAHTKGDF